MRQVLALIDAQNVALVVVFVLAYTGILAIMIAVGIRAFLKRPRD